MNENLGMTEAKAKEIIAASPNRRHLCQYEMAEVYLEAIEKAEVLAKGFEVIKTHMKIVGGAVAEYSTVTAICDEYLERWRGTK